MNKNLLLLVTSLSLVLIIAACIEPYEIKYDTTKRITVVEATLTDNPLEEQYVSLKESVPASSGFGYFTPIKGAEAELIINNETHIKLEERADNLYYVPKSIQILPKTNYALKFKTTDGKIYQSANEALEAINPIDKVYTNLEMNGLERGNTKIPAFYLYVDTKDPKGLGNSYLWTWRLWEHQDVCISCEGGRYIIDRRNGNHCQQREDLLAAGVVYDYACDKPCWEIFYNPDINVMTDTYIDGNPIIGRLIGKIPVYQFNGALIEVKQQSVSPSAFRYLKLLIEQSQSTGSLADTPPAALVGNVRCVTDTTESVAGYFMVSSVKKQLFWFDKSQAVSAKVIPLGLLGGRRINFEPSTNMPPMAPCNAIRNRTPVKPEGWVD